MNREEIKVRLAELGECDLIFNMYHKVDNYGYQLYFKHIKDDIYVGGQFVDEITYENDYMVFIKNLPIYTNLEDVVLNWEERCSDVCSIIKWD